LRTQISGSGKTQLTFDEDWLLAFLCSGVESVANLLNHHTPLHLMVDMVDNGVKHS
jgi:hypothetical protein